jgi:hypothetical protein
MKIDFSIHIESIPSDGLQLKSDWDAQIVRELLHEDEQEIIDCSPLHLNCSFSRLGIKVIIEGGPCSGLSPIKPLQVKEN